MSRINVFVPGTLYRRKIQSSILSTASPYYEALLRNELTFCYYCLEFHPAAFCLPPELTPHIVDLLFDCLEYSVPLSPYHDLVMFVRLCGFLLLSEDFIFIHLTAPVHGIPLYYALLPLIWECHRNGYFHFTNDLCVIVPTMFLPANILTTTQTYRDFIRQYRNFSRAHGHRKHRYLLL